MPHLVSVTAPSRLHFGLWSLAGSTGRQFGGVGAMIERPGLEVMIRPADSLSAVGAKPERVIEFAKRWAAFHGIEHLPCTIEVRSLGPEHVGLGVGTQLALSVAAGLNAFFGLPSQAAMELALSVRRAARSAVGTYGFVFGGLLVEQGKLPDEPISPLDCRIDLPEQWRFVLVRPRDMSGLAGEDESEAFRRLPAVPPTVTEQLIAEVRERLIPAAATADFSTFAQSVYDYGRLAGQCFAPQQGGPYNGPLLRALVERIRALGYTGVAQSSWGPTIFVVVQDQVAADELVSGLGEGDEGTKLELSSSPPCNRGARVEVFSA